MRSLYTESLSRMALQSAARTNGTSNGTSVDLGVFGNDFRSALFVVTTATITDGTHAVTVQESADASSWVAVPADRVQGTLPSIGSADDNVVFEFGVIAGTAQYLRVVATTTGSTTGGVFSAVAVLSEGSNNPVARS